MFFSIILNIFNISLNNTLICVYTKRHVIKQCFRYIFFVKQKKISFRLFISRVLLNGFRQNFHCQIDNVEGQIQNLTYCFMCINDRIINKSSAFLDEKDIFSYHLAIIVVFKRFKPIIHHKNKMELKCYNFYFNKVFRRDYIIRQ